MRAAWLAATVVGAASVSAPVQAAADCDAAKLLAVAGTRYGVHGPATLAIEGHGYDFGIGQSYLPGGPWPRFRVTSYRRWVDLDAPASDLVQRREQGETPPRGGARQPLAPEEQHFAVAPGSPQAAKLARELTGLLPAAALRQVASGKPIGVATKNGLCTVTAGDWTLLLSRSGDLRSIRTTTMHDVLGPLVQETRFSGAVRSVRSEFPKRIVQTLGGLPVLDLTIDRVSFGVAGAVAADAAPPKQPWMAPERLPTRTLGEGIYVFPGRYTAIAIDTGADITLLEAPQSEARTIEILGEIERLMPGKKVARVFYTHAHSDHIGGLRTVVGRGATLIMHRENAAYVRALLARTGTPVPPIQEVDDTAVIGSGVHAVQLYHLRRMDHAKGMLIAYLPGIETLFEADAFIPTPRADSPLPAKPSPYTVQLLDEIDRLGLKIGEIIPTHYAADGRQVGMADLRRQAGR